MLVTSSLCNKQHRHIVAHAVHTSQYDGRQLNIYAIVRG